jgi:hypothetical protein
MGLKLFESKCSRIEDRDRELVYNCIIFLVVQLQYTAKFTVRILFPFLSAESSPPCLKLAFYNPTE